jgi:hypothetical protein
MGEVFEGVCREFVHQGKGLRFKPVRTGRWWDGSAQNEIDIVAVRYVLFSRRKPTDLALPPLSFSDSVLLSNSALVQRGQPEQAPYLPVQLQSHAMINLGSYQSASGVQQKINRNAGYGEPLCQLALAEPAL